MVQFSHIRKEHTHLSIFVLWKDRLPVDETDLCVLWLIVQNVLLYFVIATIPPLEVTKYLLILQLGGSVI